jgi:hypothetical protein
MLGQLGVSAPAMEGPVQDAAGMAVSAAAPLGGVAAPGLPPPTPLGLHSMNLAVHADGAAGPEVQLQSIELVQYVQHAETLHCSKACRCLCNFALKERETYENVIAIRDRFKSMVDPSPRPPVPAPAAAAADVPAADGAAAPHASSSSAAARAAAAAAVPHRRVALHRKAAGTQTIVGAAASSRSASSSSSSSSFSSYSSSSASSPPPPPYAALPETTTPTAATAAAAAAQPPPDLTPSQPPTTNESLPSFSALAGRNAQDMYDQWCVDAGAYLSSPPFSLCRNAMFYMTGRSRNFYYYERKDGKGMRIDEIMPRGSRRGATMGKTPQQLQAEALTALEILGLKKLRDCCIEATAEQWNAQKARDKAVVAAAKKATEDAAAAEAGGNSRAAVFAKRVVGLRDEDFTWEDMVDGLKRGGAWCEHAKTVVAAAEKKAKQAKAKKKKKGRQNRAKKAAKKRKTGTQNKKKK